jgi:hypothetical protein
VRRGVACLEVNFNGMSNIAQSAFDASNKVVHMDGDIQIAHVAMDHSDGIIVTFSDGTIAGYVVEELLELRPHREPIPKCNG